MIMQDNKTLLAFDTTSKGTSLALYHQGHFYELTLPEGGSQLQSSQLVPALLELCSKAETSLSEVTTVLTLAGPGSFTGIRLGLATAIGLKTALKCETFAPSSLHVMAFKALKNHPNQTCLSLIDTQREDFYGLLVDSNLKELQEAQVYTLEDIHLLQQTCKNLIIVSNIPIAQALSTPLQALDIIHYYQEASSLKDWSALYPYYIRHPEFVKQKRYQDDHS